MTRHVAADLREAEDFIRRQQPFRLKGPGKPTLWATCDPPSFLGHLPPQHSVGIETAEYVVMSYTTPIAWLIDGEAVIPDVGYTPTTSQHQYLAADGLGVVFRPARGRDLAQVPRQDRLYGQARRLRRGGLDGGHPGPRSAEPYDPHAYGHPGTNTMEVSFSEQDALIEEISGYSRPHP